MEQKKNQESFPIEIANAVTHGFGVLVGLSSLPLVTAIAMRSESVPAVVGAVIYGFSFLMLFTFSMLYHAATNPVVKHMFKVMDHISIYFLIAGTYTPFLLIYLLNALGITLLSVLWSLAFIGIAFKIFSAGKFRFISTLVYVAMGWIFVVGGKKFFVEIPLPVLIMIGVGGLIYTLGAVVYVLKPGKYFHVIWHFMVLAAAICHYVAVLLAVLDSGY